MMVCKHRSINKQLDILSIVTSLYNSLINSLFCFLIKYSPSSSFLPPYLWKISSTNFQKKSCGIFRGNNLAEIQTLINQHRIFFLACKSNFPLTLSHVFLCFDAMLATPKWFFYLLWKWLTKLMQTLAFSNSTFCVLPFIYFILFH